MDYRVPRIAIEDVRDAEEERTAVQSRGKDVGTESSGPLSLEMGQAARLGCLRYSPVSYETHE